MQLNPKESVTDIKKAIFNPFPGLRPFTIKESHLFFGREGQVDEVLLKLQQNRFAAIVGPSGSGKSSFVYCGVIPLLLGGFFPERSSNWNIITSRPGGSPIENLAEAILQNDEIYVASDREKQQIQKAIVSGLLRGSSMGIAEAVKQSKFLSAKNTLVLIDQFEELFRFRKQDIYKESINESLAFVNLLTEAMQNEELPIYVAITMRSDFVGECAFFPELTQAINNSYYMIPQMTREQKRRAILGPVAVGGATVTPRLVQQLLNDVGDNPDQLPILQHALMRTWSYWETHHELNEPIDVPHYNAIGRMEEALSQHANEAFDELTEQQKLICERLFKSLTERGAGSVGSIRRPTKLSYIAATANAPIQDVIQVIEKFREPRRSLLMPPYPSLLHEDSIIDISHESLMRIWSRLKNWVEEEGEAVQMYQRLSEAALAYQVGKAALWRPPDLQLALNWKLKHKPTLAWAERYNPAFERTMVFLEYSQKEYETEQRIKEQQQKKALRRARLTALFMGGATIVSIGFLVFAMTQKVEADRQKELAVKNAKDAQTQRETAEKNAREAELQREAALASEKEAQKQREAAVLSEKEALKQREAAERSAAEAEKRRIEAIDNANEADKQRKTAEANEQKALKNERDANEQRAKAEQATKDAYNLRLLSIAQAMAVKSVQMTDPRLKALNAQQAFLFNRNNGGKIYHPDIFDGLYYAIKAFKGRGYSQLKGHNDAVRAIATSPMTPYMYSAGSDGKVLKWDQSTSTSALEELQTDNTIKRALAMSRDGRWLAAGGDAKVIWIYDLKNGDKSPVKKIDNLKSQIWHLSFSADGKTLIAGCSNGEVLLINNQDKNPNAKLIDTIDSKLNGLCISNNGKVIAGTTQDGKVITWSSKNNFERFVFFELKNYLGVPVAFHAISFNNDGSKLAAGDEKGDLHLWIFTEDKDKKTGDLEHEVFEGHKARINNIQFNQTDSQLATGSFDKTVRLWNMNLRNINDPPIVLKDHSDWVWSISYSADNTQLIAGCRDNLVRIWYTNPDMMRDVLCDELANNSFDNFSEKEWARYVADDIRYELTCEGRPKKQDIQ